MSVPRTEHEKKVREYLARIGRRGGTASRRELTRTQAKTMVAIREAKRAAKKEGKPWPPRNPKLRMIPKARKPPARRTPAIRKGAF